MTKPSNAASRRASAARLLVPSAASLAVHGLLLAGVLAVTVTVTAPRPDDTTPLGVVTLDLRPGEDTPDTARADDPNNAGDPDAALPAAAIPPTRDAVARVVRERAAGASDELTARAERTLSAFTSAVRRTAAGPAGAGIADSLARSVPVGAGAASFGGLSVRAAQRIVYVVDASGAMVATLPFVIDELEASIERLEPTQQFTVVLFGGGTRVAPGPFGRAGDPERPRLRPATPEAKREVIQWARAARPRGPSDPLDGLAPSLRAEPDLIFMLARSIRRSRSGAQWGIGPAATLRALEDLNPRNTRTGRRPAVIKTLQFIEVDPTGLMESIAGLHGDGAADTRVITPDELRRLAETPEEQTPAIDLAELPPDEVGPALADAVIGLGSVERSGAALRALYGLATPIDAAKSPAANPGADDTEADATRRAALDAVTLIDEDPRLAVDDDRIASARGRALLLAAAASTGDQRRELAQRAIDAIGPERDALDTASLARELARASAHRLLGDTDEAARLLATVLASPLRPGLLRGLAGEIELERARQAAPADASPRPPRTNPFFDAVSRTADAGWSLLYAETLAAARFEAAQSAGARFDPAAVIAPLNTLLGQRDILRTDRERRGLAYPRLAAAVELLASTAGDGALDTLPLEAVFAAGLVAEESGDGARAEALLLRVAARTPERADDEPLPGNALLVAARVAQARGDREQSARLLGRLAKEHPDHPDAPQAIAAAIENAGAADRPGLLAFAIESFGAHPFADAWRLLLAADWADERSLALLDDVAPTGGLAREAQAMTLAVVDELLARTAEPSDALLRRSVETAEALNRPDTSIRRGALASRLIDSNPAEAEAIFTALIEAETQSPGSTGVAGGVEALRLGRARALAALGRPGDAVEALRRIVARIDRAAFTNPAVRTETYWAATTLLLELAEANGGERASIAAHLTRLRLLDPDLGGEPWRARLDAVARRVGGRGP
jgi:hypothetical protein